MHGYHTYLLSSFPMLSFDGLPPFTYEQFIHRCRDFVSEGEAELLMSIPDALKAGVEPRDRTLERWIEFEVGVRNEGVRLRAERLQWNAERYLRKDGAQPNTEITHLVQESRRSSDPLEGERVLDRARWRALDELGRGHYFDTGALVIYALKLQILLRWQRIRESDGTQQLEAALERIKMQDRAGVQ